MCTVTPTEQGQSLRISKLYEKSYQFRRRKSYSKVSKNAFNPLYSVIISKATPEIHLETCIELLMHHDQGF